MMYLKQLSRIQQSITTMANFLGFITQKENTTMHANYITFNTDYYFTFRNN